MFGAIKMVAFVFWTTKRICPYELAELVVAETPGALSNIVQVNIDDRFTYNILINWYHVTFVAKDRWYPTPYYNFYGIVIWDTSNHCSGKMWTLEVRAMEHEGDTRMRFEPSMSGVSITCSTNYTHWIIKKFYATKLP